MNDTEKIYQNITGKRAFHYGSPTVAYIKWLKQPLKSKLEKPEEEISYCENCGKKRDNTTDIVCKSCGNEFEQSLDINEQLKNLNTNVDMLLKTEKEVKPEYVKEYYKSNLRLHELEEEVSCYEEEEEKRATRIANILTVGIFIFFIALSAISGYFIYDLFISLSPLIIEDIMLSCIIIGAIASIICLVSYSVKDL